MCLDHTTQVLELLITRYNYDSNEDNTHVLSQRKAINRIIYHSSFCFWIVWNFGQNFKQQTNRIFVEMLELLILRIN